MKSLAAGKRIPEAADPKVRVKQANAAARVQLVRTDFINAVQVYPFSGGALYQVYTAPGQITAQITEAVYDSPSGKYLLVPRGAKRPI
ncbi:type IV secretory pathway VirB9-like protein [Bradyrhizobium sp. RT9b]